MEKVKKELGRKKKKVIKSNIISIRFSNEQLEYIDYIIALTEQVTGFPTDRSKVIGKALDKGLEAIEEQFEKIKM